MKADVLVAGGGSAGLAAAIAAARHGARTLLVESHGSLGGMAPHALVHSICGLYRLPQAQEPAVYANDGFPREFAERLVASGGARGPVRMGRVDVLLQNPAAFASLADRLVRETPNLEVRLHSTVTAAAPDASSAEIECRGRKERYSAGAIVDATGDGSAGALIGAAFEQESSARLQRPAFIFGLCGVEAGAVGDDARLRIAQRIVQAVSAGRLPAGALGAALREGGGSGQVFATIDLAGGDAYDPTDGASLTSAEMNGREIAGALAEMLRDEVQGFARSYISAFPCQIGVRESRRLSGKARLTEEDLRESAQTTEGVAWAAWPIELRETNAGARMRYPQTGEPATIPLGALRAERVDKLFMAGRCISCSHEAQASIRVIGTCLATGEAAGTAAALLAGRGSVDAAAVRSAMAGMTLSSSL